MYFQKVKWHSEFFITFNSFILYKIIFFCFFKDLLITCLWKTSHSECIKPRNHNWDFDLRFIILLWSSFYILLNKRYNICKVLKKNDKRIFFNKFLEHFWKSKQLIFYLQKIVKIGRWINKNDNKIWNEIIINRL